MQIATERSQPSDRSIHEGYPYMDRQISSVTCANEQLAAAQVFLAEFKSMS